MRFFNNDTRKNALTWWRGLSRGERFKLAVKHHKDKPYEFVSTSSMLIEKMFTEEVINPKSEK